MGDFDGTIGAAWSEYRVELADRLAHLAPGASVLAEQNHSIPEGAHGVVEFTVTDDDRICATINSGDLHSHPETRTEQIWGLGVLGWTRTGDHHFRSTATRDDADDLAARVIATFREVWDVLHPTFLDDPHAAPREWAREVVTIAHNHSDLRAMVHEALESMSGRPVVVDPDGDIPMPTGETSSWLRILTDRPTVEFFGTVVDSAADLGRAYEFIATSTLPFTGIKLIMHDRCMVAVLTVEVSAFSRQNLAAGIAQWLNFMDFGRAQIQAALAGDDTIPADTGSLTGGSGSADTDGTLLDADLPEALIRLIELDSEQCPLEPEQVAAICDHDATAILDHLGIAEEQYMIWTHAADDAAIAGADSREGECRAEWEAWAATARQLRAALRVIALTGDHVAERGTDQHPTAH
ncbi:TY-Chap domain-containing protein [Gordonia sp. NPDC003504]